MIDTSARLIAVSYEGEFGKAQRIETQTPIFCELDSVNRAEFYAAFNSGFRPEFRITTDPVNYTGQTIIELDSPEGAIRCDIYRTYRKSQDVLELWCARRNEEVEQVFTFFTAGRRVTVFGAYLEGINGVERTNTGRIENDTVTLILPQTFRAFIGDHPVAYCKPKAWSYMSAADQADHFYIDSKTFFVAGDVDPALLFATAESSGVLTRDSYLFASSDIAANAKYQTVNAVMDDVYLVQSVEMRNRGKTGSEYLEVVGK